MSYLPYRQPRDLICKYGNAHPNGFLCNRCREDARIAEENRLQKKAENEEENKGSDAVQIICPKCHEHRLVYVEMLLLYRCEVCRSFVTKADLNV